MNLLQTLKEDWKANHRNLKGILVVTLFRFAHLFCGWRGGVRTPFWILSIPYLVLYRIGVEWLLGIEIPQKTKIGSGLAVWHGQGIVINDLSELGANVQLRQNVTIGNRTPYGPCPVIEDDVDIGAGAFVLGPIRIGRGAKIGAGAVVIGDVPAGAVAVGNPARVLQKG